MSLEIYQGNLPEKAYRAILNSLDNFVPSVNMSPEETEISKQRFQAYVEAAICKSSQSAHLSSKKTTASLATALKRVIYMTRREGNEEELILSELENLALTLELIATKKSPRRLTNP